MTTDSGLSFTVQRSSFSVPATPIGVPAEVPATPVGVRAATLADLAFIDALQKRHSNQVGWMPTKQLEEKIGRGQVIVAEATSAELIGLSTKEDDKQGAASPEQSTQYSVLSTQHASPLGYLIGQDQYFKRDDVGIIYQVNVASGRQRGLVGATLVKAMLERAAYGCRLFCCWCAQDIEANRFWASLGFVPLAFRTGSRSRLKGKPRVHIFWQRRVRSGDDSTPWWFPSQTSSGSIREARLVLPIPPGVKWDDEMPVLLPEERAEANGVRAEIEGRRRDRSTKRRAGLAAKAETAGGPRSLCGWGWVEAKEEIEKAQRKSRAPREPLKNDPKHVAAARELRDRWLEAVNGGEAAGMLVEAGKYDVSRTVESVTKRLLPAA